MQDFVYTDSFLNLSRSRWPREFSPMIHYLKMSLLASTIRNDVICLIQDKDKSPYFERLCLIV